MVEKLYELSRFYLQNYDQAFKRYFLNKYPLKGRFYIIIGQRGIGKTTLLVQYILGCCQHDPLTRQALYVPVDHTYVSKYSLYEIAETFYKEGVKLICLDEIHKYPDWSRELKSIYDVFTDLRIIASGSSALEIYKSSHDLSRRAVVYRMQGMSFREFIAMMVGLELNSYPLDEILNQHEGLANRIIDELNTRGKRVLPLFRDYLQFGYYPYFNEHLGRMEEFYLKLEQDVRKTVESDSIAVFPHLNGASTNKILNLLSLITESVPYTPDLIDLKRKLEIGDSRTLKGYLKFLADADVLLTVSKKGRGLGQLEKPDKIYLNNTNLIYSLGDSDKIDKGSLRETFFANSLSSSHKTHIVERGDFLVDDTVTFEVGEKNKSFSQIRGIDNAYLAVDDIEVGLKQKIPLWLFGFLY
jgi:predicted AAA+ superfamily ATPase